MENLGSFSISDLPTTDISNVIQTVESLRRPQNFANSTVSKSSRRRIRGSQVSVYAGGLEGGEHVDRWKFVLEALPCEYTPKTFGYTGSVNTLSFVPNIGWGIKNRLSRFVPILVDTDNYASAENHGENILWRRKHKLNNNDSAYVYRETNVAIDNSIKWGSQNAMREQKLSTHFSSDFVTFQEKSIVIHKRGSFYITGQRPNRFKPFKLLHSHNREFSHFSYSKESDVFYGANEKHILAIDKSGKELWKKPGKGPILADDEALIGFSETGRSLQIYDRLTGEVVSDSIEITPRINRGQTDLCLVSCESVHLLLLISSNQNRITVVSITNEKAE